MHAVCACSLFGVRPWWKRHLTKLQITQFAVGAPCAVLYLYFHLLGPGCTETFTVIAIGCFDFSLIVLFSNFYRSAYKPKTQ